ncbi:hypothetical protein C6P45_000826 [Maudiozyma exigua]|uniref:Peptidase M16 C-terminal domain-containing protein n=1 Tax=Maudiozyma exigua TaxID=34358 RepID=A0A9P6W4D7_MAUEX|nr:hypothetical protein C6P45_000826 [Kazachstania exigua]
MLEKQRLLFPEGSGYRSETGGLTDNLRDLTNEEIQKFHHDLYSSSNLCLIICGNVPEDELLEIVNDWNLTLPQLNEDEIKRPFMDTEISRIPDKRTETVESEIEFPELDESQSEILLSWIGEKYLNYENDLAVSILLEYFTESALAPFTKELVEIEDPMANSTDYWTDDFMRTIINIGIHGVPTEKLTETKEKVLNILATHKIDLDRIKQVVDNNKWEYILRCEKNGDSALSQAVITDFLYGSQDGTSLNKSLKDISDFGALAEWTLDQWQNLLNRIFIQNKPVVVLGRPSSELYEKIEKETKEFIEKRKAEHSEKDIDRMKKELEDATLKNNTPIPESLLNKFNIEDPVKSVDFITTETVNTTIDLSDNKKLTQLILDNKPDDFPLFLYAQHFPSQFIEFHCVLDSTLIDDQSLLPLYHIFNELFSMPMKDGDKLLSFEDVVTNLKTDTVDYHIALGVQGTAPDLIDFRLRCKVDKYEDAVAWIKHCLFDMVFDENRVSVLLENYVNSIVELKREGDIMLDSLINRNIYTERSVKKSVDPLFVEETLEDILEAIEDGKFNKEVLPRIEKLRDQLIKQLDRFQIIVLGDMEKIGEVLFNPWISLVKSIRAKKPQSEGNSDIVPPIPKSLDTITELCKSPGGKSFIISTPASESSYMNVITSIPFNLNFDHPDYAAVSLASEYLQCVEGPFWKGIRGSGLAYGANMVKMVQVNCWGFSIYRGSDIMKCYETGKQIVEDYANGTIKFDGQLILGAISSIINRIATVENGYVAAAMSKYVDDILLKRGSKFNDKFLSRLNDVTVDDLKRGMQDYFVNLFDKDKSVVFVSCHPTKSKSIKEFLEKRGFEVETEELDDDETSEDESD